jgi:DNA mismatch repair ATPase MutS
MFLHAYLSKTHPHILLPPLPYKHMKKGSVEPKALRVRTRMYDRYLKQLLRGPGLSSEEIKSNQFLVQFLSQSDRKEFDVTVKVLA